MRAKGEGKPADELESRRAAVKPTDAFTFIYTSGTTGPPKGCVLTHGNYAAIVDMVGDAGEIQGDEVIYLYLPLAHSFALLIQLAVFDLGGTLAYFGGDTKEIIPELQEVKPTYLPSVPARVREDLHARPRRDRGPARAEREEAEKAIALGVQVRNLTDRGQAGPARTCRSAFDEADERFFANVRAIFGGSVRHATSGAAPIAKEILEFFWACGVPVLEGYGMTETATAATTSTVENHKFGTVGRALPGVELKIAEDGEILVKGPNIFDGYHNRADASFGAVVDGWLHTGDLGSVDEDGYLSITGRKKDIIITAGGKNLTPANIENDLKQSRWISQAVMHGDARPLPGRAGHARRGRDAGLRQGARPARGHRDALQGARGARADPGRNRQGQHEIRPGRAGQEVLHPRPRPLAGDGRADADAEGQAQRGQREVRRSVRRPVCRLSRRRPNQRGSESRVRSDPADNGGLFVGRRPGTAPVHYRDTPERKGETRQRVDGSFANTLFAGMVGLSILCWGPIPVACLWIGSEANYLTGSVGLGILLAFAALFGLLLGALVAAETDGQRVDPRAPRRWL